MKGYRVRLFDAREVQVATFETPTQDPEQLLSAIGRYVPNPDEAFTAKVEDENGSGFWMHVAEKGA